MSDALPRTIARRDPTEAPSVRTREPAPGDAATDGSVERMREPSWEWGWHDEFPRGALVAGDLHGNGVGAYPHHVAPAIMAAMSGLSPPSRRARLALA